MNKKQKSSVEQINTAEEAASTVVKEETKQCATGIKYSGDITIKLTDSKNKIIKTYGRRNHGTSILWKFFRLCLKGDKAIESYRPNYIALVNATISDDGSLISINDFYSSFILKSATTFEVIEENKEPVAVLHFRIPYARILSNELSNINAICLFCGAEVSARDDATPSAYLQIDNSEISGLKEEYTLIIEWKMSFNNM